jgi:hypothetical protein
MHREIRGHYGWPDTDVMLKEKMHRRGTEMRTVINRFVRNIERRGRVVNTPASYSVGPKHRDCGSLGSPQPLQANGGILA